MSFSKHFQNYVTKDPFTDIIGLAKVKSQLLSALLTDRHVLIMGQPGIGKTTLAKNVAKLLPDVGGKKGLDRFIRIQGSPDLTVEDLIGDIDPQKALEFGPLSKEAFVPGKIFQANEGILFFDEVNRCSEKLQNALLQALEEGVATIGSYDVDLPANFLFIGTLNPQDTSTEKLSDAFLDRFDVIEMSFPETPQDEVKILQTHGLKLSVDMPPKLVQAIVDFVRSFRDPSRVKKMPGVRASLGLYERAQANALLNGNKEVTVYDIQQAIPSVITHRIELKPSLKYSTSLDKYVMQEFERIISGANIQSAKGDLT
ncbi:MAG: AAA family ATPase [Candidatus Woesearchaeota archaeon]